MTLVTAAIFTVIFSPWHEFFRSKLKFEILSAILILLIILAMVIVPLGVLAVVIFQQATDVLQSGFIERTFNDLQEFESWQFYQTLPDSLRQMIESIDLGESTRGVVNWLRGNIGAILAGGAQFTLHLFMFFIFMFYFLINKDGIYNEIIELSPFKDKLDRQIIDRINTTIRTVMFGALVIALVQATMATIGLTIFGVPKSFLWGSLVLIAAQIPMVGVSLIMVPSAIYLFATGATGAGIGLLVWSLTAVGLVDNVLSPLLIGRKTKMPELLVMISILGGLQVFGPIGFILGPVIVAMLLVVRDLYKDGILR